MKLPSLNFNFFKKPSTTKKRTTTTTFGKRRLSTSSSTHKSRRTSSGRKGRKRSITYYAPSKSKFYPTEYFPSLQRMATQATAVAATPIAAQFFQPDQTVSTDIDPKLFPSSGTFRTQTAKHTYLCDDNRDFNSNRISDWYTKNSDRYQTQSSIDLNDIQKSYSNAAIDPNGNIIYDENYRLNSSIHFNNNSYFPTTYPNECSQIAPSQTMINTIANAYSDFGELHKQHHHHHYLPSNLITAYNNTTMKHPTSATAFQATQLNQTPFFGNAKKLDRHRRRKVRIFVVVAINFSCGNFKIQRCWASVFGVNQIKIQHPSFTFVSLNLTCSGFHVLFEQNSIIKQSYIVTQSKEHCFSG